MKEKLLESGSSPTPDTAEGSRALTPRRKRGLAAGAVGTVLAVVVAVAVVLLAAPQANPQTLLDGAVTAVKDEIAYRQETFGAQDALDDMQVKVGPDGAEYMAGVALVSIEDGADVASVSEQIAATGLASDSSIPADEADMGLAQIELREGVDEQDAIARFGDIEGVGASQPNYVYELESSSAGGALEAASLSVQYSDTVGRIDLSNPISSYSGGEDPIGYQSARTYLNQLGVRDRAVTVAVMDTYIYTGHYDLAANIVGTYDAVWNKVGTPDPSGHAFVQKGSGHGTIVAGVIAAVAGNRWGPDGVGGNKVGVYGVGVSSDGRVSSFYVARGYDQVMKCKDTYNIRVVNLSLGGKGGLQNSSDRLVISNIDKAGKCGILTVCAAGNNGAATTNYRPGDYAKATGSGITVMALDKSNAAGASFSNYNTGSALTKELSAPGYLQFALSWDGRGRSAIDSGYVQGTSVSAPMVSAAAACMFAVNPKLTPAEVRSMLKSTATKLCGAKYAWGTRTGYGRLNMLAAVKAAASSRFCIGNVNSVNALPYTGRAVTPSPQVKSGSKVLRKGTDYTLSYKNNVRIGMATVTAIGKGAYKGLSATRRFQIYRNYRIGIGFAG